MSPNVDWKIEDVVQKRWMEKKAGSKDLCHHLENQSFAIFDLDICLFDLESYKFKIFALFCLESTNRTIFTRC